MPCIPDIFHTARDPQYESSRDLTGADNMTDSASIQLTLATNLLPIRYGYDMRAVAHYLIGTMHTFYENLHAYHTEADLPDMIYDDLIDSFDDASLDLAGQPFISYFYNYFYHTPDVLTDGESPLRDALYAIIRDIVIRYPTISLELLHSLPE